jgi:cardiolipin synthase
MDSFGVWSIVSAAHYLAALVAIEYLLRNRREPRGTLAWILALLLLPVVSLVLFLLIGSMPVQRRVQRRRRRRRMIDSALTQQMQAIAEKHDALAWPELAAEKRSLIRLASRVSQTPVTRGNDVQVYHEAEKTFLQMSLAIEAARHHIHFEYYIFSNDDTGRAVAELLSRKAAEGVEVRLLLDAVGSWKLGRSFVKRLRQSGIRVEFFLPWGLTTRRFHLNFRNHRKLVIVDGQVGFTGSQNIGDEYLGRKKMYGPWRDTHLRVRGPAVAQFQEVFVEDWHFATGEDLSAREVYFPRVVEGGNQIVQVVPSGPDARVGVMHQLLHAALSDAEESVSLITPYFVPDRAMLLALESAALRGVTVQLMVPSRSDHWFVLWAGRSYYDDLLTTGVEIYEYDEGMLHSKVVTVDQRWAMVGSANMDERSFRLNFELTTLLYDEGLAKELHEDFETLRGRARRVERKDVANWTYGQTLMAGIARLATPML